MATLPALPAPSQGAPPPSHLVVQVALRGAVPQLEPSRVAGAGRERVAHNKHAARACQVSERGDAGPLRWGRLRLAQRAARRICVCGAGRAGDNQQQQQQ